MPSTVSHSFHLLGLGLALPDHAVPQQTLARSAQGYCAADEAQRRKISRVYERTTVRQRGTVLTSNGHSATQAIDTAEMLNRIGAFYPARVNGSDAMGPTIAPRMARYMHDAPPLAIAAARRAIDEAGVSPGEIAQLVAVSCTGFAAPGVDFELIRQLGLNPRVGRTMIGFMGCHGALNGLRVARSLAMAEPGRPVLLCCVELCSLHFQYGYDPQQIVANALFADGAAACVGVCGDAAGTPRVIDHASVIIPDSEDDMTWVIRDHGFEMTLSSRVPELIETHLRPWVEGWLSSRGMAVGDIASWIIHPGGPRVITAVERSMQLPDGAADASRAVLAEHGNMSSPTVLFILDRVRRSGTHGPCVMLAFGPGLTAEAALLAC